MAGPWDGLAAFRCTVVQAVNRLDLAMVEAFIEHHQPFSIYQARSFPTSYPPHPNRGRLPMSRLLMQSARAVGHRIGRGAARGRAAFVVTTRLDGRGVVTTKPWRTAWPCTDNVRPYGRGNGPKPPSGPGRSVVPGTVLAESPHVQRPFA